jgi:Zn finger protein HypA/HybF involved in hydrogenase expression
MSEEDKNGKRQEQEDVSLYEKFISRTEELIDSGRKNLDEALKRVGDELVSAGHFTREQSEKIAGYVKKDIQQAVDNADKARAHLKEAVDPQRVAVGAQSLMSRILTRTAETLNGWAQKSEQQLEFKTGEITSPGTLTCKKCHETLHMKKTARIPPCPQCHGTLFRKSY